MKFIVQVTFIIKSHPPAHQAGQELNVAHQLPQNLKKLDHIGNCIPTQPACAVGAVQNVVPYRNPAPAVSELHP